MTPADLIRLGVPLGRPVRRANDFIANYCLKGLDRSRIEDEIRSILAKPTAYAEDPLRGSFARSLLKPRPALKDPPADYHQWGSDLDPQAVQQMEQACRLPVAVAGALMPDAHIGYGLPIGGVLATQNAVIPYAVGVDIACRMKMTVLDLPVRRIESRADRLISAIESETRFGIGGSFQDRRQHPVMDADWSITPITRELKDKAWSQLGTSGSGNHFVEFGTLEITAPDLTLPPGLYLALLSHSGSRGTGAAICNHYSKLAVQLHPDLPHEISRLAWLDLDSEPGQEYWNAMELMGQYAAANHAVIHQSIAANLGAEVLLDVENHHNFAWKEHHFGQDVIVHRKGATPASTGTLGIIPGSMAAPGFLVRGKGNPLSLQSASHGAGRCMSRTQATKKFSWKNVHAHLQKHSVRLISAGLDEVPMAYKDIHTVMAAQTDLIEPLAQFNPRLVKMAPAGERPED
jgi:tRNA-splicing ligase RtcB